MRAVWLAACLVLAPVSALAASPFDGTWKIDVNSVKAPSKPQVHLLADGMYSCKSCTPPYTVSADGKPHPISGNPYNDEVAVGVVDANTIKETDFKGGKAVGTTTVTVAPDGKTATVDFTDSSNTNAAPVKGKVMVERVAVGPAGSHAASGSWVSKSYSGFSDNGLTMTFAVNNGSVTYSDPTGHSYTAKIGGPAAPYQGDPGVTTVSVTSPSPDTLVESDMRDGKVVTEVTMKTTDGKSMAMAMDNKLRGTTTEATATKQ